MDKEIKKYIKQAEIILKRTDTQDNVLQQQFVALQSIACSLIALVKTLNKVEISGEPKND